MSTLPEFDSKATVHLPFLPDPICSLHLTLAIHSTTTLCYSLSPKTKGTLVLGRPTIQSVPTLLVDEIQRDDLATS